MDKLITFRFDIDSHLCLSEGVPCIVKLAKKFNVKFTFFANTGRAIHHGVQIKNSLGFSKKTAPPGATALSAKRRLGLKGFLETLLLNPKLARKSPENLRMIVDNGHELGLHGGTNHDLWRHGHRF